MNKTMTSILMASALAVASTAAIAAPKDRGGKVSVDDSGIVTIAFENRGDCQSTTAKLRNGIRGVLPTSSSTENAVAKPLRTVLCQEDGAEVDLFDPRLGLSEKEINAIIAFIKKFG
jgi:hypothetical protein